MLAAKGRTVGWAVIGGDGGRVVVVVAAGWARGVVVVVVVGVVEVVRRVLVVVSSTARTSPSALWHAATAISTPLSATIARRSIPEVSRPTLPYGDRRMAIVEREWVALTSPTGNRA